MSDDEYQKKIQDEVSRLADMVYGLLCLLMLISFPVSMPIVAAIRMIVTKRNMRKQYGRDELMGD